MLVRGDLTGGLGLVCVERTEAGYNVFEAYVNGSAVRVSVPRTRDLQPPSLVLVSNVVYSKDVVLVHAAAAAGVADVCERIDLAVFCERSLEADMVLEDIDYFGNALGYRRGRVGGSSAAGRVGAISVDVCRIDTIAALFYFVRGVTFYRVDVSVSYFYNDADVVTAVRTRLAEHDEVAGDGGISACA